MKIDLIGMRDVIALEKTFGQIIGDIMWLAKESQRIMHLTFTFKAVPGWCEIGIKGHESRIENIDAEAEETAKYIFVRLCNPITISQLESCLKRSIHFRLRLHNGEILATMGGIEN